MEATAYIGKDLVGQIGAEFIATVMVPQARQVAPPDDENRAAMTQVVKQSMNYVCTGKTGTPAFDNSIAHVSDCEGIIIWNTQRGAEFAISHYGFLPAASSFACFNNWSLLTPSSSNSTGLLFPAFPLPAASNGAGLHPPSATTTGPPISQLHFLQELVLPYNNRYTDYALRIEPSLSQSFSTSKTFAGVVALRCTSNRIDSNVMNGRLQAAAIASSVDVAQSDVAAYGMQKCKSASISPKDATDFVDATVGVVAIMGPDIQKGFVPPDQSREDYLDGIWATFDGAAGMLQPQFPTATGPCQGKDGVNYPIANYWISPWQTAADAASMLQIDQTFAQCQNITPATQSSMTGIGERDCFDIRFEGDLRSLWHTGTIGMWKMSAIATHVFATVGGNASAAFNNTVYDVQFRTVTETKTLGTMQASMYTPSWGDNDSLQAHYSVLFEPKVHMLGGPYDAVNGGKYIGTNLVIAYQFMVTSATGGADQNANMSGNNFRVSVRARQLGDEVSTGPIRVLQWRGFDPGQTVDVQSTLNVLAVPNGTLSQFVQLNSQLSIRAFDYNQLLLLQALFQSNNTYRRVYALRDRIAGVSYADVAAKFAGLRGHDLVGYLAATCEETRETAGAGAAAGVFESLLPPLLKQFAGRAGETLGEMGGTYIGRHADSALGLSAAEFGDAAGSFAGGGARSCGSATGVFGLLGDAVGAVRRVRDFL